MLDTGMTCSQHLEYHSFFVRGRKSTRLKLQFMEAQIALMKKGEGWSGNWFLQERYVSNLEMQ